MKKFFLCTIGFFAFASSLSFADQFHYHNIIMGDRAMGLGGAYGGVSDDASGVVYNPAGLAFALSNDISGSANAFYRKRLRYKKVLANSDYYERSEGQMAPFLGGLQKLDHLVPGLVWAFGIYTTDSELKDQDDKLYNEPLGSSQVLRFHRTANVRASTNYIGTAVAKRLASNFSIGFGVNYFSVDELSQIYQDSAVSAGAQPLTRIVTDSEGQLTQESTNATLYQTQVTNLRQRMKASGLEPVIGLQMTLGGRLSFGLTLKKGFIMSEELVRSSESTLYYTYIDENGRQIFWPENDTDSFGDGGPTRSIVDATLQKPLGDWPAEVRAAMAHFASASFLWTLDIIHRTAVDSGFAQYKREAVTNFATGMEWYMTSSIPLRLGLFSNYDARPEVDPSKVNQDDHVDYHGASVFLAWVSPNSQISLGSVYQVGSGESQKIQGSSTVQKIDAEAVTLAFSATHSF